jgi:branched-chain amino acid transport system permease protein
VTQLLQFTFQGLALGAIYALVALGFVIIYKSTGVINFAQGELMLLGTYLVWAFQRQAGLPFLMAVLLALVVMAGTGWSIERSILRHMVGRPVYAVVMITIALSIVIHQVVTGIWGFGEKRIRTPWGATQLNVGDVRLLSGNLMTILVIGLLVAAFFAFFRYSRFGVAMRATAFDQEAALAVGIPVTRVYAWSWMIAAVLATIAGVFLADFPRALHPGLSFVALRAFPAAIVGGLDSPNGAVVGGMIIGLVELMVQGYQPQFAPWLGENVHVVAAYAVMIIVLIVRPYGLFGTREVQRV